MIRGGDVVDGTGALRVRADVGITGDEITAIGDLEDAETGDTIDAAGLIVAPGFIDTHAHSDGALLNDPQHENGIRQGITTEIIAQDGMSFAPLSSENYRSHRQYLSGILQPPPEDLDTSSIGAFLDRFDRGVACNVVMLVPHGPVRLEADGFHDRPLAGEALDTARRLTAEGMTQGARGLSTGLSYYPQSYSTTEELSALCEVVAEHDGVYVTHVRNHNEDRAFGGGDVPEALEIARRSGVKAHISHYRTSVPDAGQLDALLGGHRRREDRRRRRHDRVLPVRRRIDGARLLPAGRVPRGRRPTVCWRSSKRTRATNGPSRRSKSVAASTAAGSGRTSAPRRTATWSG